jgi:hypothetical protein
LIVNSFAKSGTHLLAQVAEALPNTVDYGTFIAVAPAIRFRPRTEEAMVRMLERVVPGEVARAHLWHRLQIEGQIRRMNAVHLFIYRDPRDVVVSEAFYLADMAPWHRLSRNFRRCSSLEERVSLSIGGLADAGSLYPDVGRRFADYVPWLVDPNTVAIRFEDVVSERFAEVVRRVGRLYSVRSSGRLDGDALEQLVGRARAALDPSRSHTFRQGTTGAWRDVFTPAHKSLMKEVAGSLLVDLGYETGLGW